jgi:uncharacterized protein (DUF362 family)
MPIERRTFLRAGLAASLAALASPRASRADAVRVGVGRDTGGYAAARRAIDASGGWPPVELADRTVIVKPNLVLALPPAGGATTDPEVVRAVVDLALEGNAREVLIVESGARGANFSACGYDFFRSYDPQNRVRLLDLGPEPVTLAPLAGGLAYSKVYMPDVLLDPGCVLVSVGKLKTHIEALASLSMKNLFGLPAVDRYLSGPAAGRFAMHDRGLSQTIVDVNRLRPSAYAVIDGIWGMEGAGPLFGTPVAMNTVLAGRNAVAVDRVGVAAMQIRPASVRHLAYAARFGLGPADMSQITLAGDTLETRPFVQPPISPVLEYPRVSPAAISPSAGQGADVLLWYADPVVRSLDVLRLSDETPDVQVLRTLVPYAQRAAGFETLTWDGRGDDGSIVPPGRYAVHVRAYSTRAKVRHADAVGWVTVGGPSAQVEGERA